jgi:hypothetical protein
MHKESLQLFGRAEQALGRAELFVQTLPQANGLLGEQPT